MSHKSQRLGFAGLFFLAFVVALASPTIVAAGGMGGGGGGGGSDGGNSEAAQERKNKREAKTAADAIAVEILSDIDGKIVGYFNEVEGNVYQHADGVIYKVEAGDPMIFGDIIETAKDSQVNMLFDDNSSMAVAENSKLTIDKYIFDPATGENTQHFGSLRGLFEFTSGLIGMNNPAGVNLDTPHGGIGIRGTKFIVDVGDGDNGKWTIIDGSIFVKGNDDREYVLDQQYQVLTYANGTYSIEQSTLDAIKTEYDSRFLGGMK